MCSLFYFDQGLTSLLASRHQRTMSEHRFLRLFLPHNCVCSSRSCFSDVSHSSLAVRPHHRLLGEPEVTAAAADLALHLLRGSNSCSVASNMFSWLVSDCRHAAGIPLPQVCVPAVADDGGSASATAQHPNLTDMSDSDLSAAVSFDLDVLQRASSHRNPVLGHDLVCQTVALCEALLLPSSSTCSRLFHTQLTSCAFDTWAAAANTLLAQSPPAPSSSSQHSGSSSGCAAGSASNQPSGDCLLQRSIGFISQVLHACERDFRPGIIPSMLQWIQQAWHIATHLTVAGQNSRGSNKHMPGVLISTTRSLQPMVLQSWLQQSTTFSLGHIEHLDAAVRVQAVRTLQALLTPGSCDWLGAPTEHSSSIGSSLSSIHSSKITSRNQPFSQTSDLDRTGALSKQQHGTVAGRSPVTSRSVTPSPEPAPHRMTFELAGEGTDTPQLSEGLSCKVLAAAFERLTDVDPAVSAVALAFLAAASPAAVAALSRDPFGDMWTPQWQEAIASQQQVLAFRSPQLSRLFELLFRSAGVSSVSAASGGVLLKRRVEGTGGTGPVAPGEQQQQHLQRSSSGGLAAAAPPGGSSVAGSGTAAFCETILAIAAEVTPVQLSRGPDEAATGPLGSSKPASLPLQSSKSAFGSASATGSKDNLVQRTAPLSSQPPRPSTMLRSIAIPSAGPRDGSSAGGSSAPDADLIAPSQPTASNTAGLYSAPQSVAPSEASTNSELILPGSLTSVSSLAWLLVQEAAKQLVVSRLRTHFGGPTQTFGMLDKLLQGVHARLISEAREKANPAGVATTPSTAGTKPGASLSPSATATHSTKPGAAPAAAAETAADVMCAVGVGSSSGVAGSDHHTAWLMLEFLSALERGIYLGCDGITRKEAMPQASLAFYETNRKVSNQFARARTSKHECPQVCTSSYRLVRACMSSFGLTSLCTCIHALCYFTWACLSSRRGQLERPRVLLLGRLPSTISHT